MGVIGKQRKRRAYERVLSAHDSMTFGLTRVPPNNTPHRTRAQALQLFSRRAARAGERGR
jgi:hypothetical protein